MIIGLTGAHRSGKTTLGNEFAKRNKNFTFAATSVSAIMAHHGFDPQLSYHFPDRLGIQNIILDELDAFYGRFADNTVFDRTPLDAAAYLFADIQREGLTKDEHEASLRYLERAFDITNRRFTMLLFVPNVLPLVEDPTKAPATKGYVEHIQAVINGFRVDQRMRVKHFSLPRFYVDLDLRVRAMENATKQLVEVFMNDREARDAAGVPTH